MQDHPQKIVVVHKKSVLDQIAGGILWAFIILLLLAILAALISVL